MLRVLTPKEVFKLIDNDFSPLDKHEVVALNEANGRVLAIDIKASEYVPNFNRSTVDGYALKAEDTFGCTDSIPAVLKLKGQVLMGKEADFTISKGECCYVPTGGEIPNGADCTVMVEYSEDYLDGTIGIMKPGSPGLNMIFRGDDVFPGKTVLEKGRKLTAQDIGALASMGIVEVPVSSKIKVGIISTGDELVPPNEKPGPGQIRDVNSPLLEAMFNSFGAESINYGIVKDDKVLLSSAVEKALDECDVVVLSGGSSVGLKDATCEIIESFGELLLHGIAVKPGKPTILGKCSGKPVVGLPGHPGAAGFITEIFVLPLIARLENRNYEIFPVKAVLPESIGANHGRAQFFAVKLEKKDRQLIAHPVRSKAGLITQLAGSDGFFEIERDCEGLQEGAEVEVICHSNI